MIEIKKPQGIMWVKVGKKRYPRMSIPDDVVQNPLSFLNEDVREVDSTYRISEGKIVIILEKMEG